MRGLIHKLRNTRREVLFAWLTFISFAMMFAGYLLIVFMLALPRLY